VLEALAVQDPRSRRQAERSTRCSRSIANAMPIAGLCVVASGRDGGEAQPYLEPLEAVLAKP